MFENKTIVRLEQMLDAAMDGTFVECDYDESRLSRLESRWKEFLGSSVLSNQNLETERHRLETFISDISHQTKTPMTIIKMYSELLREEASLGDKASVSKIQKFADEICRQNARLEFLIDSLTKLSRLENGTLSIVPTEGEIDKLIKTSISSVASKVSFLIPFSFIVCNISFSHFLHPRILSLSVSIFSTCFFKSSSI